MDIVERLEEHLRFNGKDQLSHDAKSAIERLREALREISCDCDIHCRSDGVGCDQWIAHAALKGDK